ncbi:MAG TPA: hypothetical protein VIG99_23930 [Myxococcaceae bacterium]
MKRAWPWVAVGLAAVGMAACWDFETAYKDCINTGRCKSDGGGDDGGGDGGGACPAGSPTGNGLCLAERFGTSYPVHGIAGFSPSNVLVGGRDEAFYAVRSDSIVEYNASLGNYALLGDLDGLAPDDVWASTSLSFAGASLYHYNGSAWSNPSVGAADLGDCNGVWVEDAGYAFAACEEGLQQIALPNQVSTLLDNTANGELFNGVWGVWNGPAWVVGYDIFQSMTVIRQRSGATWNLQLFPGNQLRAIHGRSDHDVWAVGDTSTLMHLDDAGWHTVPSTVTADFKDVYVLPSGQAWVATYDTRLMVIDTDGGQRTFTPPGLQSATEDILIQRVRPFPSGDVWVTATSYDGGYYGGAIFHYQTP